MNNHDKMIFLNEEKKLGKAHKLNVIIIACGFQQIERVDYFDTYAPNYVGQSFLQ